MGLGDKFKNLAKQAQDSVVEHKDQLQGAVEAVSVAADRKTKGRHTDKITRMGQKASDALDRLDHDDEDAAATGGAQPGGEAQPGGGAQPGGEEHSAAHQAAPSEASSAGEDRLG
jgi:hypothetical protein